ncbi:MAG: lycopene cyclase domain-containing protein [Actinomycetes bacterium]|jgi:lycopene cyclase domain-containing protein
MSHLSYLVVITFVAICAFSINLGFRLHIGKQWRNLIRTQIVIVIIYLSWDAWAIAKKSWFFDARQIVNFDVLPKVPVEELLFFIVVPLTIILSYLSLLKITGWNQKRDEQ